MPTQSESTELHGLESDVRELAAADSPAAAFRLILESCRRHAPRAALFLVRKGQVRGWAGYGYRAEAVAGLRTFHAPLTAEWNDGRERPDFSQFAAHEAQLIAVEVKSRPIGFVLVERGAGERPWRPEGLRLLVTVARLRLELDLALRRAEAGSDEPVPARTVAAPAAAVADAPAEAAPAPAALRELAPDVAQIDSAAAPESPETAAARRFARLIATDIRIYHEDDVLTGQRQGDLSQRLGTELDLGKQTFLKRHADLGPAGLAMLREAYVEVLAGGKSGLIPRQLLD